MDPRSPGSFPPGGPQPPWNQPYGQPDKPGQGAAGQPGFGGGFGDNPNAYSPPGAANNPYGNPFSDPRFQPQPPKKSLWWLWLLLGGGGAFACLLCCGLFGLVYVGFNVIESELTPQLQRDPVVQEHLGEVKSVEFDFMKSVSESEKSGDSDTLVFHVEGSKGSGDVIGRTVTGEDGAERLEGGILRLPSGEEFQLSE
jgi:hypothetical protein